jgi:hypothetical protein
VAKSFMSDMWRRFFVFGRCFRSVKGQVFRPQKQLAWKYNVRGSSHESTVSPREPHTREAAPCCPNTLQANVKDGAVPPRKAWPGDV